MKETLVPQLDTAATGTEINIIDGQVEATIPLLSTGEPARFIMLTVNILGPIIFKVGLAGVDATTHPHGCISLHAGPVFLNVSGQTTIDFDSASPGRAYITPLGNQ